MFQIATVVIEPLAPFDLELSSLVFTLNSARFYSIQMGESILNYIYN